MDQTHRITIDPLKRSGQPCLRGIRMTVQDVLDYLAGGMSYDEFLESFPNLELEDIHAALQWTANAQRQLRSMPLEAE